MLRFYYNQKYKYTNRTLINTDADEDYTDIDYVNIDSTDTINGHIIYTSNGGKMLPTYIIDLDNNHRYFVTGITPLSARKKVMLSLLRDVLSESNFWKNEDAYIQSGFAKDFNKYKTWGLPFTNTKMKEQRLDINGKSSFFVYYVNTQKIEGNVLSESDLNIKSSTVPGITGFDYSVKNLNEIPNYNFVGAGDINIYSEATENSKIALGLFVQGNIYNKQTRILYNYKNKQLSESTKYNDLKSCIILNGAVYESFNANQNNAKYLTEQALNNFFTNYLDNRPGARAYENQVIDLDKYVNKIIYNSTNQKIYKIHKTTTKGQNSWFPTKSEMEPLFAVLRNIPYFGFNGKIEYNEIRYNPAIRYLFNHEVVNYTIEELGVAKTFDFNFKANTRKLPKSAVRCVNIVADADFNNESIAQTLMLAQTNGINEKNDTGRILDIQYLPFSVATTKSNDFKINQTPLTAQFLENDDFNYVKDLPDITNINKETDSIKIVSPSRSSQFLFKPYNNNGNMIFNIKITIKPNASIIYVRPSTRGLLLTDFDDKNSLIIQEDFSLTNVSSQWTNYIYSNRNYQNTFNREIQGRDFQRSWERRIESANARSDTFTARNISASKARTYTGNLPIISGLASAIGSGFEDQTYMEMAKLDREYNEAIYQESISLAEDNFKMQLENIQSQPNIPTSITTIDCKLLDGVYLEFYSTNETEKQAINQFYKFNGHRIDSYGKFEQYYGWYVKGKIVRSINYTQPEINEINKRLELGIYTEVEYD